MGRLYYRNAGGVVKLKNSCMNQKKKTIDYLVRDWYLYDNILHRNFLHFTPPPSLTISMFTPNTPSSRPHLLAMASPLWPKQCSQIMANRLLGPSPMRKSRTWGGGAQR